ncbi:STAS domain-containing protein [Sphingomonas sp.]|uniref:STAS domain-containing protein n=1 Tax=Sphingomonas sp. TaxID=28214 RepID=UPI0031D4E604
MTALSLAPVLDTSAATALRQTLLDLIATGDSVVLDGGQVAQVGQACLQVLASAQAMATSIRTDFELQNPSEALTSMIALAGLDSLVAAA